jgi:hypothetical protein
MSNKWHITPGVDEYDNEVEVSVTLCLNDTVVITTLDSSGDVQDLVLNVQDLIHLVNHGSV